MASDASRLPTHITRSPGRAPTKSIATVASPCGSPLSFEGCSTLRANPSRSFTFCVATTVPLITPNCIRLLEVDERLILRARDDVGAAMAIELFQAGFGGFNRGLDLFLAARQHEVRLAADALAEAHAAQ